MISKDIREKYIKFFITSPRDHKEIEPAPLVLENDPTTLFTSAGMQPLIPYLKGEPHPLGKRLVDSQPSLRLQDIEEVGDNRHTTFFEMLGNWSLGDYFKKEQLAWFWEFLTKELGLPKEKLYVSVFSGGNGVERDTETEEVWKKLGISDEHIHFYGVDKNWWSRSGPPDKMPVGEIGGPDSEVFYDFGTPHNPKYGEKCHPNCDCGRFLEIGNSVFIQYEKQLDGSLKELPQKNVDFGGGLERLTAALNNSPDLFKIDLFWPIVEIIVKETGLSYERNRVAIQVIADHLKAASFIIKDGVRPSNKLQGYVLRRLLRRSAVKIEQTYPELNWRAFFISFVNKLSEIYPDLSKDSGDEVVEVMVDEVKKFYTTLRRGLKEFEKLDYDQLNALNAFNFYQSYGFPVEIIRELFSQRGVALDEQEFRGAQKLHADLSRKVAARVFKGGLAADTPTIRKYHTATHLLHQALRQILGTHVQQAGSNITDKRLRFDFKHPKPLTEEEKERVEKIINKKIDEDLPVTQKIVNKDEALRQGALAFFGEKYPNEVKVYTIGKHPDQEGGWYSKELCGGPHVEHTSEIGHVKITKEESAGAGVRRIYMQLI